MSAAIRAHRQCLRPCTSATKGFGRISTKRSFSSLHPSIRDFASSLAQTQPCFRVSASQVRVLFQPHDFYQTLLDMIRRAQKHIFISSLYIGSSESELIETLHLSLTRNPALHVYLQLDLNRSTRPGPSSTTLLILPLLKDFPDRFHVSLFRSPKLKGLMARLVPPRFNEGWGTWHAKIYGADNDIMISGANLNKSYFTDRQDRYIYFSSEPNLAAYCLSYLRTASTFSYHLKPQSPSSYSSNTPPEVIWPDPSTHPHHIEKSAAMALSQLQQSQRRKANAALGDKFKDEVLIFPVIQAGQFNVREEERCLQSLFEHLTAEVKSPKASPAFQPLLHLTSGYFGLYKPYQKLVLNAPFDTHIICASPKSNGFYGSRGVSGRIPEGYTLLEQRFMRAVREAGRSWTPAEGDGDGESGSGIELNEWQKDGWTYHAKGIWLSPTPTSPPILTLFGSTNLNSRSSQLDTELSFMMLTSSMTLRNKLHEEVTGLRAFAEPWKGSERKVRCGTKALVGAVGGML